MLIFVSDALEDDRTFSQNNYQPKRPIFTLCDRSIQSIRFGDLFFYEQTKALWGGPESPPQR
ncbi:MAG: hypothetical protein EAZ60_20670 [Oscillatoriales cyanobacterium]|nr:MAG: hypothetical protein EAZ60_20670 [Oscillatoriales cyanobacterium]